MTPAVRASSLAAWTHTVNDHILAESLIDEDTLVQIPGATGSP